MQTVGQQRVNAQRLGLGSAENTVAQDLLGEGHGVGPIRSRGHLPLQPLHAPPAPPLRAHLRILGPAAR